MYKVNTIISFTVINTLYCKVNMLSIYTRTYVYYDYTSFLTDSCIYQIIILVFKNKVSLLCYAYAILL